jgi:Protein of unknown function (DUF3231)
MVEESIHNVPLTTGEIANLWTQYMNDSLAICVLSHTIETTQDKKVMEILEFARSLSEAHIEKITHFSIKRTFQFQRDLGRRRMLLN